MLEWVAIAMLSSALYYLQPCLLPLVVMLGVSVWRRRRLPTAGRVVYIVGADSGIGFSSAHFLAAAGCRVLAGCVEIDGVGARRLRRAGIETVAVDVRSSASVSTAAAEAARLAGADGLWAVIFNAGVLVLGRVSWLTESQVQRMVAVNVLGAVRVMRTALPALAAAGGRLVVVSSACTRTPAPMVAVYSATKAALSALTVGFRLEACRRGVSVVLLSPGNFSGHTNILARQSHDLDDMAHAMDADTRREEGAEFEEYRALLSGVRPRPPAVLTTPRLRRAVLRAVLDATPLRHYTAVEAGTLLWLALAWLLPAPLHDRLVLHQVQYWLHRVDVDWLDLNNLL